MGYLSVSVSKESAKNQQGMSKDTEASLKKPLHAGSNLNTKVHNCNAL